MGQPVTVVSKPAPEEGILIFELNRSITGMGHKNYFRSSFQQPAQTDAGSGEKADAGNGEKKSKESKESANQKSQKNSQDNLADEVAHLLFDSFGERGVEAIHINSNILTLQISQQGEQEEQRQPKAAQSTQPEKIPADEVTKMLEEIFLYYK